MFIIVGNRRGFKVLMPDLDNLRRDFQSSFPDCREHSQGFHLIGAVSLKKSRDWTDERSKHYQSVFDDLYSKGMAPGNFFSKLSETLVPGFGGLSVTLGFPYDPDAFDLARQLPAAQWDANTKSWTAWTISPSDSQSIIDICDRIEKLLAVAEQRRHEKIMKRIDYLRLPAFNITAVDEACFVTVPNLKAFQERFIAEYPNAKRNADGSFVIKNKKQQARLASFANGEKSYLSACIASRPLQEVLKLDDLKECFPQFYFNHIRDDLVVFRDISIRYEKLQGAYCDEDADLSRFWAAKQEDVDSLYKHLRQSASDHGFRWFVDVDCQISIGDCLFYDTDKVVIVVSLLRSRGRIWAGCRYASADEASDFANFNRDEEALLSDI